MLVKKLVVINNIKKGKELKVPHHASAAATRDDRLPHSQHWQLFFCGCHLYTYTAWLAEQIPILLTYYCRYNISLAVLKFAL